MSETTNDYAHCVDCDKVVNLDEDKFTVQDDETYCEYCGDASGLECVCYEQIEDMEEY